MKNRNIFLIGLIGIFGCAVYLLSFWLVSLHSVPYTNAFKAEH
jgi:hypothetical protein